MASTVEKIVDNFPYTTLTPIAGLPDYESLAELHTQSNSNSSSIQSNLGGGNHGLLAITLEPAVLNTLTATPFVIPINPGATAVIPAASTAAQITSIRKAHDDATKAFHQYVNVDKALKQQLIEAVDDLYLKALRNKYVGFSNQTFLTMIAHLYLHYAKISPTDLSLNDQAMKKPYDPNLPIENLFEQINDAVEFAAAGKTPYTTPQIESTAYQLVFNTGVFGLDCKEWRKKALIDKTWANFIIFFTERHMDWREEQMQTVGQGYSGQANAVEYQRETVDAIACLATATATDREALKNLTATNLTLTNELASTNAKLITALLKITKLTEQINNGKGGKGKTTFGTAPKTYYCHSHGYACPHHSGNCPAPKDDHNKHATNDNKQGGLTTKYKPE